MKRFNICFGLHSSYDTTYTLSQFRRIWQRLTFPHDPSKCLCGPDVIAMVMANRMLVRWALEPPQYMRKYKIFYCEWIPVKEVSTHSDFTHQFKLAILEGSSWWKLSQFQEPEVTKSVAHLLKKDDSPLHLPPLPHNFIWFLQNFLLANLLSP